MNKTLQTKSSNINIINFVMILGVFVFLTMGCQQITDLTKDSKKSHADTATNSNTTTNTNATANSNATANANANVNANSNVTANSNANTNDKNANAPVANPNASTEPTGTPKPPEVKAFENNLAGNWSDDTEKVVFSKDEVKFYDKSNGSLILTWKYNALDAKTVELTDKNGQKSKATMTFEDNNATLKWTDSYGAFTYKREAAKP